MIPGGACKGCSDWYACDLSGCQRPGRSSLPGPLYPLSTTCVICRHTYSDLSNELNVQGICSDCYQAGGREAPDETCRSCQAPITPDTSVPAAQVNPSDPAGAWCLDCIKAGRFSRQEPDEYAEVVGR